jgi:hypothetical protein
MNPLRYSIATRNTRVRSLRLLTILEQLNVSICIAFSYCYCVDHRRNTRQLFLCILMSIYLLGDILKGAPCCSSSRSNGPGDRDVLLVTYEVTMSSTVLPSREIIAKYMRQSIFIYTFLIWLFDCATDYLWFGLIFASLEFRLEQIAVGS